MRERKRHHHAPLESHPVEGTVLQSLGSEPREPAAVKGNVSAGPLSTALTAESLCAPGAF